MANEANGSNHSSIEEYIEYIEDLYADLERVEISADKTRIWAHTTDEVGVGAHWSEEMMSYGYAIHSCGGTTVEFNKIEDGEFVEMDDE